VYVFPVQRDRPLLLRAAEARFSLSSVFALLPKGRLLSAATGSVLNLCDAIPVFGGGGDAPVVCAGYKEERLSPHYRLLRGADALLRNTTVMTVETLRE